MRFIERIAAAAALSAVLLPVGVRAIDRDIVISVYQGPCADGDFKANLEAARKAVAEAVARKSHFLALPETFLSGYDTLEHVTAGSRPIDDPDLAAFIAESSRHDTVVLAGLARRAPEGIYNSVLAIHRGKLLGIYDKVLLTGGDRDVLGFIPGTSIPVLEAHGVRFAVAICHDTSFPHPALAARLQGAEILFTPHYNEIGAPAADAHRRWVRNCHVGLACQMKMAVARANVVRTDRPGMVGYGDSFILSPSGEVLASVDLFREGMATATLTPALFRPPSVWADLDEVPPWLRERLAELLREKKATPEK